MYTFESRIRYSEIGRDNRLSLKSLAHYFQDCSTLQSEDLGIGIDYLEKKNRAWLMSSWQIEIYDLPKLSDRVTTGTWAYGAKSMFGLRNFIMYNEEKEHQVAAVANSNWVFTDLDQMRPVKVRQEDVAVYGMEEPYPMEYLPRKIKVPKDGVKQQGFYVNPSNIDTYHHVNNGEYISMAESFLPADYIVKRMRVDYRSQARMGDQIIPVVTKEENCYTIVLQGEQEQIFAIVKFE